MKRKFFIADSQFDRLDSDAPDSDIILEALSDVYDQLGTEDVWTHKGNYQLSFWIDEEVPDYVHCNVYVLANPDDLEDISTLDYCYYYAIQVM